MPRTKRLLGTVAVVTDAVSAVGAAVSDQLACEGARLLIVDPDGNGAAWRAKEINLLVTGLDPNFSDVGEDPWGTKQSAAPFQSTNLDSENLLIILRTAVSTFKAPVNVIFDTSGSIDVNLLRELAHAGAYLPSVSNNSPSPDMPGNKDRRTIVTITGGERPSLALPKVADASVDCPEGQRAAGDVACAHVFCGDSVWRRLMQVSDLPSCDPEHGLREGCVDMQCEDLLMPIAHLVSCSGRLSGVFDSVKNDLTVRCSVPRAGWDYGAGEPQNVLLPVRLWFDVEDFPDMGPETGLVDECSKPQVHEGLLGEGHGADESDDHDQNRNRQCQGSNYSAVNGKNGSDSPEPCGDELADSRPKGPVQVAAAESRDADALTEWGAYCGVEFSDDHLFSLDDKYAVSVGVNAVKYTMRYLFVGYIIVTFAMPKMWGLYNSVS